MFDHVPEPLPAGLQTGGRGGRPEDEADSGEPHQPGRQVGDPLLGEVIPSSYPVQGNLRSSVPGSPRWRRYR